MKTSQKIRPFQLKKKKSAGENSKNDSRGGFSGWTSASFACTGGGAALVSVFQPFDIK